MKRSLAAAAALLALAGCTVSSTGQTVDADVLSVAENAYGDFVQGKDYVTIVTDDMRTDVVAHSSAAPKLRGSRGSSRCSRRSSTTCRAS